MKKLLFICLALIISLGATEASNKKKSELFTAVFNCKFHCQGCVKKVEDNLAVLGKGVKDVNVEFEKSIITVVYDAATTTKETITKNFKKLDINVDFKSEKPYEKETTKKKK